MTDATGLGGRFDLDLTWRPDGPQHDAAVATDAPSIFTAVEEQLGLKLRPATTPTPVLVVDHVERPAAD